MDTKKVFSKLMLPVKSKSESPGCEHQLWCVSIILKDLHPKSILFTSEYFFLPIEGVYQENMPRTKHFLLKIAPSFAIFSNREQIASQ